MARASLAIVLAFGLLAAPLAAGAQPAGRTVRLGYLGLSWTAGDPRIRESFVQGMRDLGYVEGRNLLIESRYAEGKPERFAVLAAELVALKVDVILTVGGSAAALAARHATTTIPIVFTSVGDPVGEGIVRSLARPGGNITGLSVLSPELVGKTLEVLKQAVPGMSRAALLLKPDAMPEHARKERIQSAEAAARALSLQLHVVEARGPADFERAFADIIKARADALTVLDTPVFGIARQRLVELATRNRIPTVYSWRAYVEAGGLFSYGPDLRDLARRAATYVDKIVKGARPGDVPVEQPTKFELVVNLKAAAALELIIPPSLLGRADQVIE